MFLYKREPHSLYTSDMCFEAQFDTFESSCDIIAVLHSDFQAKFWFFLNIFILTFFI